MTPAYQPTVQERAELNDALARVERLTLSMAKAWASRPPLEALNTQRMANSSAGNYLSVAVAGIKPASASIPLGWPDFYAAGARYAPAGIEGRI